MAIYLKKFENHTLYETYINGGDAVLPNVSICVTEDDVHYNPVPHDYSQDYLTFTATESGTFSFNGTGTTSYGGYWIKPAQRESISYSLDNGETWTTVTNTDVFSGTVLTTPTVQAGDKVLWKGIGTSNYVAGPSDAYCYFSSTGIFTVEGNAMSLLYGDDFVGQTDLSGKDYVFYRLFIGCTRITSAENLSLPATTLAECCYEYMFRGCTSLTTAPQLPATTLANNCYQDMFQNCTSLTTAPQLPATIMKFRCYNEMFNGCTSLTTAPLLPATTLAYSCYGYMFQNCTSLNSITCLATDISATGCTSSWVGGVASSGTFTKNASMSNWTTGASGIPSDWTVVDAS